MAMASGPPLHPHRLLAWEMKLHVQEGRGVVFALALLTNNSVFLFRAKILRKPAIVAAIMSLQKTNSVLIPIGERI